MNLKLDELRKLLLQPEPPMIRVLGADIKPLAGFVGHPACRQQHRIKQRRGPC
jgi:hypothetical protein